MSSAAHYGSKRRRSQSEELASGNLDEPSEVMPDVEKGRGFDSKPHRVEEEEDGGDTPDGLPAGRFLAIHVSPERQSNVQIGAALIDCNTGELFTLGKTIGWEGDFAFIAGMILGLAQPVSGIVVSSKMGEALLESLRGITLAPGTVGTRPDDLEDASLKLKLIIVPNAFFDFRTACRLIASKCGGDYALGSVVDLQSVSSVQAAGAALAQAQRHFPEMPPVSFDMFDLGSFLVMDGGSSRALDITRLEEHPSMIRGRGIPKEGFSLLSLLDRSKSVGGRRTLRRWVSRPLTSIVEIEQRLEAVAYLVNRMGNDTVAKMAQGLSRINDLPRSFLRLKTCTARPVDWLVIFDSLTNIQLALSELDMMRSDMAEGEFPELLEMIRRTNTTAGLFEVGRGLDTLDWELLRKEINQPSVRVVPRSGVNSDVDNARVRLQSLPDFLEAETRKLGVTGVTVRCIPVIGFVTAIEEGCGYDDPAATFLFEARKQTETGHDGPFIRYFKTERTQFLDEQLGDIPGLVRDVEDSLLRKVEATVLAYEADLLLVAHRAAELDVLLCLAEVAHDFGYCRPEMCKEAVTSISKARHPLLERVLEERFIPSDIHLVRGCLIITGPNYSGKSVILKTVALIHVLAQIGSFVPAAEARLGIVDRIFTRMSSLETNGAAAFQRESSFSIDVQQIVSMLRCCTPNSLILVDEFGKGTNSMDGSALLAAVIRYLARGKCGPVPRCIFATHLLEMFDARLISPDETQFGEMAVEFDGNEPVPLFSLRMGERIIKDSYGIACARRAGMGAQVLDRAVELTERLSKGLPLWKVDERKARERQLLVNACVGEFMSHGISEDWSDSQVNAMMEMIGRIVGQ